ncbi:MAG: ribosome rescue protein RqcH [Candidatus Hodarchaeota archaeon]
MSNIDLRLILPEIHEAAKGAFIKNVYQYGNIFVLKLYQPAEGTTQLMLETGRRVHLTEYRRVALRVPPKFCTVLRKYLRDRRILSVTQHDLDRILIIESGEEESSYKLVIELFGDGNLLLLDPEDTIFVAMRYRKMRDRDVVPKAKYVFPPPRGVDILTLEEDSLGNIISDSKANVVRTLASRLNLDSLSCEEICAISGVNPKTNASDLDEQLIKDLKEGVRTFIERVKRGVENASVILDEEEEGEFEPVSFTPFVFEVYNGQLSETFQSFSEALDRFYGVSEVEQEEEHQDPHAKERKRLETIVQKQQESIERLSVQADNLRKAGEAIYTHFQLVQDVLETITTARSSGLSWGEIVSRIDEGRKKGNQSAIIIQKITPSQGKIAVKLGELDVSLDVRKNAQDNASLAYDQAKKAEAKIKGAQKQIEKTKIRLEDLKSEEIAEPETRPKIMKIRKKRWYEKFRWFISSEGFLVLGGRDAKTNEQLAKRQMGPNDVFLHASLHGAPYTVVKVPEDAPGEQTLNEAAQFAVTFSRAWQDGLSGGEAYWVNPEQVSFTPPSGEYLPTGAVMIYGNRNFIRRVPVELAVGVLIEEGEVIPVSGPPSAISTKTEYHLRIIPSDKKKGQLVKDILAALRKMVPEDKVDLIGSIPQEDLMRVLPTGGGTIKS